MQKDTSIINAIARKYVVPSAAGFDIAALTIRIVETGLMFVLPDVYAGWERHQGLLAPAYYVAGIIVLVALAVGSIAAMYLSFPLVKALNAKIAAAQKMRRGKVQKARLAELREQLKLAQIYAAVSCSVPVLFSASFILAGLHLGIVNAVTALTDIIAPVAVLFIITQTETGAEDEDAQEKAVYTANNVVNTALAGITTNESGQLSTSGAAMLKAGAAGDIDGMINAATPLDPTVNYMSVNGICKQLGFDIPQMRRDAPERRRVAAKIAKAYADKPQCGIKPGVPGQGWAVPESLFIPLFGDFKRGSDEYREARERDAAAAPARALTLRLTPAKFEGGVTEVLPLAVTEDAITSA